MPWGWFTAYYTDDPEPVRAPVGRPDRGKRSKEKAGRKAARVARR